MDAKTVWLFVFVGLYWSYCLFWGIKGALTSRTATDYMIAGRSLGVWVFVLAATATSFSGWTFIGHPGLIYRDGLQYAYASFYAVLIPFTGVLFLKRQWMLGKRYGFITPGEMFASYFQSDLIRLMTVLVALVFSIPYLGIQLQASGFLFNALTGGGLSVNVGMWLMSVVLALYVVSGGLRAVAYVDVAQAILTAVGIVLIGLVALYFIPDLRAGLAALAQIGPEGQAVLGKTTTDGYSHYVAIPGVIQWVSDGPSATGGAWTGFMILTYMFALMGIQSAPAFSMWAFSNKSPAPFPHQQVWASAFGMGLILFIFTAIQGIGSHFLGANLIFFQAHPDLVNPVLQESLMTVAHPTYTREEILTLVQNGIASVQAGHGTGQLVDIKTLGYQQDNLVPLLIDLVGRFMPWLVGLLAVCALAAMQSTGAAYMSTAGSMITRDILRRFVMPKANDFQQKFFGRLFIIAIVILALLVATYSADALVLLGGLAVAYGFQMWPALIGICWWPFLTRQGVVAGLIAGLIAVTMTDAVGQPLFRLLGFEQPPWGRWPLTLHSAGWGILFNLGIAVVVSAFTQDSATFKHRQSYHLFLKQHASLPTHKKGLIPVAWTITLVWFFFAVGPGAVLGNSAFGNAADPSTWWFGIPSIWIWQLLWWLLGVGMMWFLAFRMEMSTVLDSEVEELMEGVPPPPPRPVAVGR